MFDAIRVPGVAVSAACTVAVIAFGGAVEAAQRTFVSTGGADANACSLAAPCRGFAKAITMTDPGGELVVLDSGGYGSVTVNKNVTILSPAGVYAGISVFAAQDGITVASPATKVVLRGLSINGQGGNNGIRVQAGEVHVENVVVSNLTQSGILVEGGNTVRISGIVARSNGEGLRVAPGGGAVSVLVRDSEFGNNATNGIVVSPSAGGASALVTVERSSVTKNAVGVAVSPSGSASATVIVMQTVASENAGPGVSSTGSTATVFVRENAITRNGTGLLQAASGILNACGSNLLVANTTAQSGSINVNAAACLDQMASGTVTSVATGAGLIGGPITATGTINLASTNLLPTIACSTNQITQWNGSAWVCAGATTGTVTSLTQGSGITLTPNPVTAAGTIVADTAYLQRRVSGTCGVGSYIRAIASDGTVTCGTDNSGPANAFVQGGNAFGAIAILGTTDVWPLEINVNSGRAMRYEPNAISPNVIGGNPNNYADGGVRGATIGGGGVGVGDTDPDFADEGPNRVTDHYGSVGGGYHNQAGDAFGTAIDRPFATVAGGFRNTASGAYSTLGGGQLNTASGHFSAVGGGAENIASGNESFVGGGLLNTAGGYGAIVPGGGYNNAFGDYSVALGFHAITTAGAHGSFVFADDSAQTAYGSGNPGEFIVSATGGILMMTQRDYTTGCRIPMGAGTWTCSSSRDIKRNFETVDIGEVLARVVALPMTTWQYKTEAGVRHLGPMAQDFYSAFGLGPDNQSIAMADASGVALAAIQGLNAKLEEQAAEREAKIAALVRELGELRDRVTHIDSLREELTLLRNIVAAEVGGVSVTALGVPPGRRSKSGAVR